MRTKASEKFKPDGISASNRDEERNQLPDKGTPCSITESPTQSSHDKLLGAKKPHIHCSNEDKEPVSDALIHDSITAEDEEGIEPEGAMRMISQRSTSKLSKTIQNGKE